MKLIDLKIKSKIFEIELISRIRIKQNFISKAMTLINKNDFQYYGKHFEIIVDCFRNDKNEFIEFKNAGINFDFLNNSNLSFRDIEPICKDLKDVSNAIKLWTILQKGVEELPSENVREYISGIQRDIISNIRNEEGSKNDIQSVLKEFEERKQEYQEKKANGFELLGISTGYKKLDDVIDGLRKGHFWIIGGYTSMGKTATSLNIVSNLIKQGKRVVFYSLEMSSVDILSRLLGTMSNDNGLSIIKGYQKDKKIVEENTQKIINSNLSIHTGMSELSEILFSMYEENITNPVDLFVVDFIQIMTIKGSRSEYETITNCALELQQCAKRLATPIMTLSQISNDGARTGDNVVMSFKGSGAIASSADLAIEIGIGEESIKDWKDKINSGSPVKMKWSIRKNRHGRVGMIEMSFDGKTGIFEDYDEYQQKILGAFNL